MEPRCKSCGQALPREKYVYAPPRRGVSMAQAKASGQLDVHVRVPSALCKHYLLEDRIKARKPRTWA